jgi:hypothetical protein
MIKIRNGAFTLSGTTAYSYSVCVVAWDEKSQTMFFNDRKYSPTTTKHQDMAWGAFACDLRPYAILKDADVPAPAQENLSRAVLSSEDLIRLGRALLARSPGARITSEEEA